MKKGVLFYYFNTKVQRNKAVLQYQVSLSLLFLYVNIHVSAVSI